MTRNSGDPAADVCVPASPRERNEQHEARDLLCVALPLVAEDGTGTFKMERLAEASGESRTALYRYFPCKEEVVIALAIESYRRRLQRYRMAPSFQGRPRERWRATV